MKRAIGNGPPQSRCVSVHFELPPPHTAPEASKPGETCRSGPSLVCMASCRQWLPDLTHHRLSSTDAHPEHHLCCQGHLLAKTVNNHKLPSVAKLPRADGQVGGWVYSKCTESECAAAAKAQLPTTAKGEAGQETLEASEDSHV